MDRIRNIELDLALVEATGGSSQNKATWRKNVLSVLSKHFPGHDLTEEDLQSFANDKDNPCNRIILFISWPIYPGSIYITPSGMTHFEFLSFCFLQKNCYDTGTTKTILELFKNTLQKQPVEAPLEKYKRHIKILADEIKNKKWRGCSVSLSNNQDETNITVISFRGSKRPRAVPKDWGIEELANYIMHVGDLPTPGQARKIANRSSISMSAITKTLERE